MISFGVAATLLALYSLALLGLAQYVEGRASLKERVSKSPVIYTLSLAVYLSAWTYYGITGQAATSGIGFVTSYLGPVLAMMSWPLVMTRLLRLKQAVRITSIADYLGARYGKSHLVAGLAAFMALIGLLPYLALQMKAILSSLILLTNPPGSHAHLDPLAMTDGAGLTLLGSMILFTIVVGIRRIDPTERHQGMVAVVALESLMKLAAFVAVGVYVCFFLFDGPGQIFQQAQDASLGHLLTLGEGSYGYGSWVIRLLLFVPVIFVLPRQFHVAVVENSDPRHMRTAIWLFPLYMLIFTAFVMPIALGGRLSGHPAEAGDTFVLLMPQSAGNPWLSFVVFLGGFSAGLSMVAINAMTMTTMVTNDLIIPLASRLPRLDWLKRNLLPLRWFVVTAHLCSGYVVHVLIGQSSMLDNMGIVSLVAVVQFTPAAILGLFWRGGNRAGALAGLGAGFFIWLYTLALPTLGKGSPLFSAFLGNGPLGVDALAPQALFGLTALDPVTHTIFWSLIFNTGAYALVSLTATTGREEANLTAELFDLMEDRAPKTTYANLPQDIPLADRRQPLERLFAQFLGAAPARKAVDSVIARAGFGSQAIVSLTELAAVNTEAERVLAGMVGAATAHKAVVDLKLYAPSEQRALSEIYGQMLAELNLSPTELRRRVDYYKDREGLLLQHAGELTAANQSLEAEVAMRRKAEEEARQAEASYRSIFENAVEGIFRTLPSGQIVQANPATARILGYASPEELIGQVRDIGDQLYVNSEDRAKLIELLRHQGSVSHYETRMRHKDDRVIWVALHTRAILGPDGEVAFIEGILEDITERKENEQLIRRAGQTVRDIIDSMPSVMIAVDPGGYVTHWNRQAALRYQVSPREAEGRSLEELMPWLDKARDLLHQALATGESQRQGHVGENLAGSQRLLDILAYPLSRTAGGAVVLRLDDVTERVRMEEMMVQSEKMFSLGGLAAGMAHEINNPLGAIIASAQNVLRRLESDRPANQDVAAECGVNLDALQCYLDRRGVLDMARNIQISGQRAAGIVHNMLEFSRQSEVRPEPADLAAVLDKTVDLAAQDYDLKKKYDFRQIRIIRDYDPALPPVPCRATEIEQVMLNLLRNAAQAMYEVHDQAKPPTITLRTSLEDAMARIEVIDNGPGMDEPTRKRAFEPFFTTKPVGTGTGLGLSVSYFIITTRHGGAMTVESQAGQGARFVVRLPLTAPASGQGEPEAPL